MAAALEDSSPDVTPQAKEPAAASQTLNKTAKLSKSFKGLRSHALMDITVKQHLEGSAPPEPTRGGSTVAWNELNQFLYPPHQEHPESIGRLEIFARYGPLDSWGQLRGSVGGSHVHTDNEIKLMIAHETREMLFALFNKPRVIAEVIVDPLLPVALGQRMTWKEVRKLLAKVPTDSDGRFNFAAAQNVILENQRRRLQILLKEEGDPKAGFKPVPTSMAVIRGVGDVRDRWDRYCAIRRTFRSSFVQARNEPFAGLGCMDDGLADKHPGVSSLVSTLMMR